MRLSTGLLVLAVGACGSGGEVTGPPDAPVNAPIDARPPGADANMNLLSQAGLYSDFAARTVAPDLVEFAPAFPLWSDGLVKRRWVRLPPGGKVDSADMDHWTFPVGTQFWKEFRTAGGTILETRLIERVGATDFRMGAYVWNDAQTEATYTTGGAMNVLGTDHDVPTASDCVNCHRGEQGRILGFAAVQVTPAPAGIGFTVAPRAQGYKPAWTIPLGYLHANCGNCHNPNGSAWSATQMLLRIGVAEVDGAPTATAMYTNIVGVPTQTYHAGEPCGAWAGVTWQRIAPMNLACSAIYVRMMARGSLSGQMPPIATKHADAVAVAAVAAWIGML
ncbi:MAG TPA: hypothetical protein VKE22_18935 [Haliangiales bacterium]|nr:hypothetical protein [Haliangiales bacterium]